MMLVNAASRRAAASAGRRAATSLLRTRAFGAAVSAVARRHHSMRSAARTMTRTTMTSTLTSTVTSTARCLSSAPVSGSAGSRKPSDDLSIDKLFGMNSFNERAQRQYLPPDVFKEVKSRVERFQPISADLTERFAAGLHRWAVEHGATHFTHWFTPLTGRSASKHDSFMQRSGDHAISTFSGKTLAIGEPDASSFPNGGIRATHQARGYTIWDASSPCFIIEHGTGATLYIPTVFISWKGNSLDEKTPLLRSGEALNREALAMLHAAGQTEHEFVHTDSGVEQEMFLVDKDFVLKRPDIMQSGRTLLGADPPRGQELSDQYFTDLSERTMRLINDAEIEMWKLGIPQTTRHKEVAPGQYEVAPVFSATSVASDQNVLVQEVLQRVAHHHGMECLLHEKPFQNLNGSGKHNNWSIGTNRVGTVFAPGKSPQNNLMFMLFMATVIRGVNVHQDLLRMATASSSNDHRLGGHEAPPAIISIYLGDDVTAAVNKFVAGDTSDTQFDKSRNLGFSCLPEFSVSSTDRNRTSPFAFTGNKFEFRAVGSSQMAHRSNFVLNAITAESCRLLADSIRAKLSNENASREEREAAAREAAREMMKDHMAIVFDGDAYSEEWHAEAAQRGLLNLPTTVDALELFASDKNINMFDSLGVMSKIGVEARVNIFSEEYANKLMIEARSLSNILKTMVIPAAQEEQTAASASIVSVEAAGGEKSPLDAQRRRLNRISEHIQGAIVAAEGLDAAVDAVSQLEYMDAARAAVSQIRPALATAREHADALEVLMPAKSWPLPSYHEMLYTGQVYDVAPTSD